MRFTRPYIFTRVARLLVALPVCDLAFAPAVANESAVLARLEGFACITHTTHLGKKRLDLRGLLGQNDFVDPSLDVAKQRVGARDVLDAHNGPDRPGGVHNVATNALGHKNSLFRRELLVLHDDRLVFAFGNGRGLHGRVRGLSGSVVSGRESGVAKVARSRLRDVSTADGFIKKIAIVHTSIGVKLLGLVRQGAFSWVWQAPCF